MGNGPTGDGDAVDNGARVADAGDAGRPEHGREANGEAVARGGDRQSYSSNGRSSSME